MSASIDSSQACKTRIASVGLGLESARIPVKRSVNVELVEYFKSLLLLNRMVPCRLDN